MLAMNDVVSTLKSRFGASSVQGATLTVEANKLVDALEYLKNDAETEYRWLEDLFATQNQASIAVCYRVSRCLNAGDWICLRVVLSLAKPKIESISKIWAGAHYYEVEAAEMYGINFSGNTAANNENGNRASLLLPPDWQGFPMLKDYVYPQEYHGIEHRRPPLRKQHERP